VPCAVGFVTVGKRRTHHLWALRLAFDGNDIKLLEYNADTPTGLLEAAVVQWFWFKDVFAHIPARPVQHHPRTLLEAWNRIREEVVQSRFHRHRRRGEDLSHRFLPARHGMQAKIRRDSAESDVSWKHLRDRLLWDKQDRLPCVHLQLYPWEWMTKERRRTAAAMEHRRTCARAGSSTVENAAFQQNVLRVL
jgi:glutathionylspermidine synthase